MIDQPVTRLIHVAPGEPQGHRRGEDWNDEERAQQVHAPPLAIKEIGDEKTNDELQRQDREGEDKGDADRFPEEPVGEELTVIAETDEVREIGARQVVLL